MGEKVKHDIIRRYEEIAMNAFPAILTEVYDGWILRFSHGYTNRGNSVNPIYTSKIDLEEKIAECEKKYFLRGLPCVFKMTENVEKQIDQILDSRGYELVKETYIMGRQLECKFEEDDQVVCCSHIDDDWLEQFTILNETAKDPDKSTVKEILKAIGNQVVCAAIYEDGEMAASGLGVYEDKKIGLYDIRVHDKYRRKGYGTRICKKIMNEGIRLGADSAYLQVMWSNVGAVEMYQKIGFFELYTYWYRVLNKKSLV